jgi:hypothetical protein
MERQSASPNGLVMHFPRGFAAMRRDSILPGHGLHGYKYEQQQK